jgi:DNA-directed RNA polymerase specialized sigma24 family protein
MQSDDDIQRLQKLAEEFDPSATPARDADDLRAIAETVDRIHADQARLRELVQLARAHGRSWGEIAIALGVSRQSAHERYAAKVNA